MKQAEIINIGDELLIGQVVNTNAAWLGQHLNQAGLSVGRIIAIADKREDILNALQSAVDAADVVFLTGGLGPTKDDITKEVLCEFFKTALVFHEESYRMIERFFASRNLGVSELNRGQAYLPASCQALMNPHGTAAGMWFEQGGVIVVSLPGVPHELKPMMEEIVLPRLRERYQGSFIVHRTILTHGMGESFLAKQIEKWESSLPPDLKLAYLPSPGIVRLRLTLHGHNQEQMVRMIKDAEQRLHAIIPDLIFGYDQDSMEGVTGALLARRGHTLSTAESCTGGYLAHLITSVPGSSAYFLGGIVAYDNEVKIHTLGIDPRLILLHGAVSEEVVCAMAEGVRRIMRSDFAIATSGIAGPDGGSVGKPVGTTWIALAGPKETQARMFSFGQVRERNIRQAGIAALNMLRKQWVV